MSAGKPERRVEASYKGLCGLERRYLATILGGAVMGLAALVGLYIGMGFTQDMPPPSLANTLCIDEKLEFLRGRPQINPNVLTVGSSIAWRNIDSAVLAENLPDAQPLNGAFCAMRVHQSLAVGEWFIQRWPSIDEMLLVVGSQDFVDCRDSAEVFDFESAHDYTFAGKPSWSFYLRYADPVSFIRNAIERAKRPDDPLTEFAIDRSHAVTATALLIAVHSRRGSTMT